MLEYWDARLDIEKRYAIQDIKIDNMQLSSFDSHKPYRGDSIWIRSPWCSSVRQPSLVFLKKGRTPEDTASETANVVQQCLVLTSGELLPSFPPPKNDMGNALVDLLLRQRS